MPEGATFNPNPQDPNTYTFSWTPGPGTAGSYIVKFIAAANGEDDEETINITVIAVDKSDLLNEIAVANQKIEDAVVGTEIGQYPQAARTAFQTAITTAEGVANNPGATQSQVNDALNALTTAEAAFDDARITSIDKSTLTTAIAAANAKVATATPGTGIGQYSQAAIDAFRAAIAAAQAVVDNANATNAEVSQAVTALRSSWKLHIDAARPGATGFRYEPEGTHGYWNIAWNHWTWTTQLMQISVNVMIYIDGVLVSSSTPTTIIMQLDFLKDRWHTIGIQTVRHCREHQSSCNSDRSGDNQDHRQNSTCTCKELTGKQCRSNLDQMGRGQSQRFGISVM
jgi:hypothetical protein